MQKKSVITGSLRLLILVGAVALQPFTADSSESESAQAENNRQLLTLKSAVERTLQNNIAIAVLEFNSKIKEQAVLDKRSEFDPSIGLELSTREETRQQASAFASKIKSRDQNRDWDLTLEQKL